jgi:hypothetical protein
VTEGLSGAAVALANTKQQHLQNHRQDCHTQSLLGVVVPKKLTKALVIREHLVLFLVVQVLTLSQTMSLEAAVVAQMKTVRAQQALSQAVVAVVAFRQVHIAEALTLMGSAVVMAETPTQLILITTAGAVQELAAMEQMVLIIQLMVAVLGG